LALRKCTIMLMRAPEWVHGVSTGRLHRVDPRFAVTGVDDGRRGQA
jgi:hypothetical protein